MTQLSLPIDRPSPAPTNTRKEAGILVTEPAGDGPALYTIEEWWAKFGKPAPTVLHYDAFCAHD